MATHDEIMPSGYVNPYLADLNAERERLGQDFTYIPRLLDKEIQRIQAGGSPSDEHLELNKGKSVRVAVKVAVPIKDHPGFNFVGKLLGPKGNTLKRLQEETQTRMAILGRGSMRDKAKEEKLRKEGDPKSSHLNEDLHVEITAFASAPEAYARMAHALAEVKRFLVPDYYDDIRQDQFRELSSINGDRSRGDPMMPVDDDPGMRMPGGRPAPAPYHMMPRERMPPPPPGSRSGIAPPMRPAMPPGGKPAPPVPRPPPGQPGRMMPPVSPGVNPQRSMYRRVGPSPGSDPRPYPPEGDGYGYEGRPQEDAYEMSEQESYPSDSEYYSRRRMYEDNGYPEGSYADDWPQPRAGVVPGRVKGIGPVPRFRPTPYGPPPPPPPPPRY